MPSTRSAGRVGSSRPPPTNPLRTTRGQNAYSKSLKQAAHKYNKSSSTVPPLKKRKRISAEDQENSESANSEEENSPHHLLRRSTEHMLPENSLSEVSPLAEALTNPMSMHNPLLRPLDEHQPDDDLPTLADYSNNNTLFRWPKSRCKEALAMRPHSKKQMSAELKNEIIAAFQNWEHIKMTLCLAGNISMRMLNKQIGNVAPTRKPSKYVNFLQYSKMNHLEAMPHPNSNDSDTVAQLVNRNKRIGKAWSDLTSDEQEVFSSRLILALAGIPDFASEEAGDEGNLEGTDGHEGDNVPEVTQLTCEEEARYRPLYEQLVAHEVVVSKLGTAVTGVSDAHFTRRSLQCIQRINHTMNAEAHRHEFQYWLVAASTVPPLTPGVSGWCKVFTSIPIMTKFITAKANFPTIFGAVAQGTSILNAVSQASGLNSIAPRMRSNLADKEKQKCRSILLELLIKAVGQKPRQGFPQGEDPQEIFIQRGIPARLELDEGSTLSKAELKLGFLKMNANGRRKWLKDIANDKFRFVYDESKIEDTSSPSEFQPKAGKTSTRTRRRGNAEDSSETEDSPESEGGSEQSFDNSKHCKGSPSEGESEAASSEDDYSKELDIAQSDGNDTVRNVGGDSDGGTIASQDEAERPNLGTRMGRVESVPDSSPISTQASSKIKNS